MIFSDKEALFKAQYQWSRKFVDFMTVRVILNEDGKIQFIFQKDIAPFQSGFVADGRWLVKSGVITTECIPKSCSIPRE